MKNVMDPLKNLWGITTHVFSWSVSDVRPSKSYHHSMFHNLDISMFLLVIFLIKSRLIQNCEYHIMNDFIFIIISHMRHASRKYMDGDATIFFNRSITFSENFMKCLCWDNVSYLDLSIFLLVIFLIKNRLNPIVYIIQVILDSGIRWTVKSYVVLPSVLMMEFSISSH